MTLGVKVPLDVHVCHLYLRPMGDVSLHFALSTEVYASFTICLK